ncbi:MAG: hypothetical protein ABW195_14915 [Ilumatobacteraceae bacterium]
MRVRRRLRRLKRLTYLGVGIGILVAVRRAKARRDAQVAVGPVASWPPLQTGEPPVAALGDLLVDEPAPNDTANTADVGDEGGGDRPAFPADPEDPPTATWVSPVGGACPLSHPVKANDNSRIFHVPGGRFYERTQAERCYRDPAAAEADGYRAAKGA